VRSINSPHLRSPTCDARFGTVSPGDDYISVPTGTMTGLQCRADIAEASITEPAAAAPAHV